MKKCGIVAVIAGLLLFAGTVWADEQTKNDGHSNGGHGTTQMQQAPSKQQEVKTPEAKAEDAKAHNMTTEEHKNMNMGGMNMSGASDSHGTNTSTHEEGASGGEHGSHGGAEVVETPPNAAVLGTFGGIMLAFILYGAITKLLRKKGRVHA